MNQYVLVFAALLPLLAFGQQAGLQFGKTDTLYSEILGESRAYHIALPEGYDSRTDSFPVLYLTEGYQFRFVAGMVHQLASAGKIPEMIVVGIETPNRNWDLSPPSPFDGENPNRGGGAHYLKFLAEELKVHIAQKYRTDALAILSGHSLGGELMLYALREYHLVFGAFICLSPSLGRNNRHELEQLSSFLAEAPVLKNMFYVAIGDEGGHTYDGVQRLRALLQTSSPHGLHWKSERFTGENHFSIPVKGHLEAFDFLFFDYYLPNHYGIAESIQLIEERFDILGEKLGVNVRVPESAYDGFVRRLIAEEEYDWALWELENRYQKQYPDAVGRLWLKARTLMLSGRLDKAVATCKVILKREPQHIAAQQLLKQLE